MGSVWKDWDYHSIKAFDVRLHKADWANWIFNERERCPKKVGSTYI